MVVVFGGISTKARGQVWNCTGVAEKRRRESKGERERETIHVEGKTYVDYRKVREKTDSVFAGGLRSTGITGLGDLWQKLANATNRSQARTN